MSQVHEFSVAKSVLQPWANTLISVTPSSIRTEPGDMGDRYSVLLLFMVDFLFVVNSKKGQKLVAAAVKDSSLLPPISPPGVPGDRRRPIDSILLNVAGRLLMLQQDPVNPYLEDKDVSETFVSNSPFY